MKKHNEGYTLPLVMVVLLVLAIVAVTIMTTSLKNMLRQQQFIETMNDQYKAQGQIEAVVAQLVKAEDESAVTTILGQYTEGALIATKNSNIAFTSTVGSVCIKCEIAFTLETGKDNDVKYTSYEIIKGGATE